MTPALERLLSAAEALKAACEGVGEAGYDIPEVSVYTVPRELFDEIPAMTRVRGTSADPYWQKSHKGVEFNCWEAPEVEVM